MRALVLSGGGSKGAFQAGVVSELAKHHSWGYVSGVSVGALNAAKVAEQTPFELRRGAEDLVRMWLRLETRQVRRSWWFGLLGGLWRESFFDSSPLRATIERNIDVAKLRRVCKEENRQLRIGAVAYGSGRYTEVDQTASHLERWLMASSAFPGFLCPQDLQGDLWFDGGVRRTTPLSGAVEAGADSIDVVLCSPRDAPEKSTEDSFLGTDLNALSFVARAIELQSHELMVRDLQVTDLHTEAAKAGHGTKRAVTIHVYEPPSELGDGGMSLLEFSPEVSRRLIRLGQKVARQELG
jgi:NTE family protein